MSALGFKAPTFGPTEDLSWKNARKGCLNVVRVFIVLLAIIIGVIIYANFFYEPKPPVWIPNSVAIKELKLDFVMHDCYKRIVEVMDSIDYDGDLTYTFYAHPGYQHRLEGQYGPLNDTFPWVAPKMKKIFGEIRFYYDVRKIKGVYFVRPLGNPSKISFADFCFVYTRNTEQELQNICKEYVICDTIVDEDTISSWLLRFKPNWYFKRRIW